MADDPNLNPFFEDDDFIENEVEIQPVDIPEKQIVSDAHELTWDNIAAKLLRDNFILTALELHTELVETGRELPRFRDYFSNPGNFERTKTEASSPTLREYKIMKLHNQSDMVCDHFVVNFGGAVPWMF